MQKQPAQRMQVNISRQMIYGNPDSIQVRKELLLNKFSHLWQREIQEMYELNDSHLIWFRDKKLISSADTLLMILSGAYEEGLQASWYNYLPLLTHKGKTEALLKDKIYDNKKIVTLDVLFTSSLYHYAHDIYYGSVLPSEIDPGWETAPKKYNIKQMLCNALQDNSLGKTMRKFEPADPQFDMLRNALRDLKEKAAKYTSVRILNPDVKYSLNDTISEVAAIKEKLIITGDLSSEDVNEENQYVYDEKLRQAVIRFQERNGLEADGVTGKNTIAALNRPVKDLIASLIVNLERLRWFAHRPDEEHIVVNLADYSMHYHRENIPEMKMKVITGSKENYTPVLKDTLEYLVFNPEWRIPSKIAREEMLPKIKSDTSYLSKNDLIVYDRFEGNPVNPSKVDWASLNEDNFNYRVVQKPGRLNSLGRVKFIFPNHRSIYLHDTPADYLFSRNKRDFSHGCVRLEKPMELAAAILSAQMKDPEKRIREILQSRKTKIVPLEHPIPVHFVYYTAWVDDQGRLNFRDDIYGFDKIQENKMKLNRDPFIRSEYN